MPLSWRRLLRQARWRSRVFIRSTWSTIERPFFRAPKSQESEGAVLLRLDGIGDFWLGLPLFASLRQAYAGQRFVLLANALWADLAHETGLFSQVVPIAVSSFLRSPRYRYRQLQALQKLEPFTDLWSLALRRRIAVEDLIAHALPAQHKYAWSRDPSAEEVKWLAQIIDKNTYTRLYENPLPFAAHEWLHAAQQVSSAGLPPLDFRIYLRLRERWRPTNGTPFIAVIGGAGSARRRPSAHLFARLAQAFAARLGSPIRLFGAANDRLYLEAIAQLLPSTHRKTVEAGSLALPQVVKELLAAEVVLAPETGLAHVAATLGMPTFLVAGGGHWGRFIPYPAEAPFLLKVLYYPLPCYGCGWHCIYPLRAGQPFFCLQAIDPEKTTEEALLWWETHISTPSSPFPRA